ncbi:MAG: hypothetical protein U0514_00250 [Candidatus Andersenbacteria bacterium]
MVFTVGAGYTYWLQIILTSIVFVSGVLICIRKMQAVRPHDRAALRTILIGISSSFFLGAIFSILANLNPQVSAFSSVETPSILFLSALVYALVHHGIAGQSRSISTRVVVVSVVVLVATSIILLTVQV